MIKIERTKIQEKLEQLNSRSRWALELTWQTVPDYLIKPFQTKEEALEHQFKVLDSIVQDYIELRKK